MKAPFLNNLFARLFFTALLAAGLPVCCFSQPGTLDSTFYADGKLITPIGNFGDWGTAIGIQSDQKIVVGGYTQNSFTTSDFAVVRYLTSGDLDTAFGTNGKVTTPIETRSQGNALAIQSDGKIVLGGASDWYINLARYNADGSLDSSFGTGGKVVTDIEGYYSERCTSIQIQSDGKILAGGSAKHNSNDQPYFLLVRYNTDGTPDSTFATNGRAIGNMGTANSMAVQPDGKIVLGGSVNWSFALERYTSDGMPDSAFGTGGTVITPVAGSAEGRSVVLQSDGKILLVGTAIISFDTAHFALARYNSNGTPDAAFGQGGLVTTFPGMYSHGNAACVRNDGKILLAGYAKDSLDRLHFALARYHADGTFDNSFGASGKTITPFGLSNSMAGSMAVQDDGRIVLAGIVYDSNNVDIALARYENDAITGIGEPSFPSFIHTIYPNPSGGSFSVRLNEALQNGEWRIYTSDGQLVTSVAAISGKEIHVFANVLSSGTYYFQLSENGTIIAADKLVIENN